MVLTRIKKLLIDYMKKAYQDSSDITWVERAAPQSKWQMHTLFPRDMKVKKSLATHMPTQYNVTTDFNSSDQPRGLVVRVSDY